MSKHLRLAPFGVLALAAIAALAFVACATPIKVNAYAERGADVSRYRSYDFAPPEQAPTGDPRLDSNPFFQDHLREAVEKALTAKGYERVASGTPGLRVHFHASVTQEVNVDEVDRRNGYCGEGDCRPFIWDAGTLLVDFVDADTNKLVWRGWAESSFDGIVDNQTWLEQRIDKAVGRIVAKMPRHS